MNKSSSILFLVQLPPPVHGVSITNKKIIEFDGLRNGDIDIFVIPMSFSDTIEEIDKLSYKKIVKTLNIAGKLLYRCLLYRPNLAYFTLSIIGKTFYRDVLYVSILKILRVNIVYHLHRVGVRDAAQSSKLRSALYKWVFSGAMVIHLTPRLYEDINMFVNKSMCYFVSNGIDDPLESADVIPRHTRGGPTQYTFLSHMVPEKGVIVMLEALVELKKRGIEFEATFAGGRISHECERAFNELLPLHGLEDKVRYIGPVYNEDKNKLLFNTDVFVFPTLYDSFGIVLLEAMGYSLPVIATIQGGIPDIVVDGETGYLVEKNNSLALADKMQLLAQNGQLRNIMGKKGRIRFKNEYTADKFESNIICALRQCLEKAAN